MAGLPPAGTTGLPLLLCTFPSIPYKSEQTHLLLTGPFLGPSVSFWGCGIVGMGQMLGQGTEERLPWPGEVGAWLALGDPLGGHWQ